MKIVIISKPTTYGELSPEAASFLIENGFEFSNNWNRDWPCMDNLPRANPILIDAIEKYHYDMPELEVVELPQGSYKIIRTNLAGSDDCLFTEIIVKEGSYWGSICDRDIRDVLEQQDIALTLLRKGIAMSTDLSPLVVINGEPRGSRTSLADEQNCPPCLGMNVPTDELKRAKQKKFIHKN